MHPVHVNIDVRQMKEISLCVAMFDRHSKLNPFDTIGVSATPLPPWLILRLRGPLTIILSPEMRFWKGRKVDWSQKNGPFFVPSPLNRD